MLDHIRLNNKEDRNMGMFTRFADIINANINSLLDKAENPEKMLKLIIQEMEETLVDVRASAAKNIAEKKSLARELAHAKRQVENWQQKAQLAVEKERDDLAKQALVEKQKVSQTLETLENQMQVVDEVLVDIQSDAARLQEKLNEAKRKQESFLVRQQSAQVRLKAREKATVHNIDEALQKFDRYQQKIDDIEAQVEAYDLTKSNDLASQIQALENQEQIDNELEELKAKVANG